MKLRKLERNTNYTTLKKKTFVNKKFNTKASAVSAGKNYGNYRGEKLRAKGNKLY